MLLFFSRGRDAEDIFETLQIHQEKDYRKHRNKYTVIHITFNDLPRKCSSYEQYIDRIEDILIRDLQKEYPDLQIEEQDAIWDILLGIHAERQEAKFIFILDEWDFILHQKFVSEEDKASYLLFLRNLLKDRPYVSLAYMTGILPIAKYSSGSELNIIRARFTFEKMCADEKRKPENCIFYNSGSGVKRKILLPYLIQYSIIVHIKGEVFLYVIKL